MSECLRVISAYWDVFCLSRSGPLLVEILLLHQPPFCLQKKLEHIDYEIDPILGSFLDVVVKRP